MSGSVYHRNRRREARTRAEGPEKPVSRAPPERVRRALALLTRTHHGCRLPVTHLNLSGNCEPPVARERRAGVSNGFWPKTLWKQQNQPVASPLLARTSDPSLTFH